MKINDSVFVIAYNDSKWVLVGYGKISMIVSIIDPSIDKGTIQLVGLLSLEKDSDLLLLRRYKDNSLSIYELFRIENVFTTEDHAREECERRNTKIS